MVIYRPPHERISYGRDLDIIIDRNTELFDNIVILGDLNEDLLDPRLHYLRDIIVKNNVIATPTRESLSSRTLLDPNILSNEMDSGTVNV